MALDDEIGPPESTKKEAPSERYMILKRNGEMTVMEKRRYLLEKALKRKTTEYASQPPYVVHSQNL